MHPGFARIGLGLTLVFLLSLMGCSRALVYPEDDRSRSEPVRSADWIAMLPEGETKRQVILGCTPCHQIGPPVAYRKTLDEWREVNKRMKLIDDSLDLNLIRLDAEVLSQWLAANAKMPKHGRYIETAKADFREFPAGAKVGFYHDMTVSAGKAWIADYFGNKLYGVDIETGSVDSFDIPVSVEPGKPGGAHQIDITRDGMVWMTFTKAEQVIRFDPGTKEFRVYSDFQKGANIQYFVMDAERYIHEDAGVGIWMTNFSREFLTRLDPKTGAVQNFVTPRTAHLPEKGVHLYAAVADSQGNIWYTETHGNRLGMLDPKTGAAWEQDMPEDSVGPKRLAIDLNDVLWIPELATGKITVYDTKTRKITGRLALPIAGDFPYGIRRNRYTGDLWITGSGSDALYRLDPKTRKFTIYRLPRRGAYTRTVSFTENGDIWTNYASFPNAHTQTPYDAGVVVRLRLR
jgi:streptogramin lyase